MWQPKLDSMTGPMYWQIRSAFLADLKSGVLKPGDKLPAQRFLAKELGVAVGTVSRAYKDLGDLGLIDSGARRGTTVREVPGGEQGGSGQIGSRTSAHIDLRGHRAAFPNWNEDVQQVLLDIGLQSSLGDLLDYQSSGGGGRHSKAGAAWFELTSEEPCSEDEVVVCNGAQHALICVLLATCSAGDAVATERMTYAGLKAAASVLDLKLVPVDIDEGGLLPASFQAVCEREGVKALVCVPNIHNPTTRTISLGRRKEIASIAADHNVTIIEDDVYGGLSSERIPSMYSLSPENVFRLTGLSKTLGPGIRIGYIQSSPARKSSLSVAIRATSWMASPLMAELASNLILSGKACEILERNKAELCARNEVLAKELGVNEISISPYSPHAWLKLPSNWTKDDSLNWAHANGIKFLTSDAFLVGGYSVENAVRISVSAAPGIESLASFARKMAETLRKPPEDTSVLA